MYWVLVLLTFGQIHGYAAGQSTNAISIPFSSEKLCQDALVKIIDRKKNERKNWGEEDYSQNNVNGYCIKTKE